MISHRVLRSVTRSQQKLIASYSHICIALPHCSRPTCAYVRLMSRAILWQTSLVMVGSTIMRLTRAYHCGRGISRIDNQLRASRISGTSARVEQSRCDRGRNESPSGALCSLIYNEKIMAVNKPFHHVLASMPHPSHAPPPHLSLFPGKVSARRSLPTIFLDVHKYCSLVQ